MSNEKKKLFKNVDLDLVIEIAKKAEKKGYLIFYYFCSWF